MMRSRLDMLSGDLVCLAYAFWTCCAGCFVNNAAGGPAYSRRRTGALLLLQTGCSCSIIMKLADASSLSTQEDCAAGTVNALRWAPVSSSWIVAHLCDHEWKQTAIENAPEKAGLHQHRERLLRLVVGAVCCKATGPTRDSGFWVRLRPTLHPLQPGSVVAPALLHRRVRPSLPAGLAL